MSRRNTIDSPGEPDWGLPLTSTPISASCASKMARTDDSFRRSGRNCTTYLATVGLSLAPQLRTSYLLSIPSLAKHMFRAISCEVCRFRAKWGRSRPKLCRSRAKFGRCREAAGRSWPIQICWIPGHYSAITWPRLVELGQHRAEFGRSRAILVDAGSWSHLGEVGPNL